VSPPSDEEDPVWQRVKSQTHPLKRKQRDLRSKQNKPKLNIVLASRPIRDASFVINKNHNPQTQSPTREDGHRRIRRGKVEIEKTLDLHGMFEPNARKTLIEFLAQASKKHCKTVLVITGKGVGGRGVLRSAFPNWLRSTEVSYLVSGYAQAHIRHGGSGAWYVFLRKPVTR